MATTADVLAEAEEVARAAWEALRAPPPLWVLLVLGMAVLAAAYTVAFWVIVGAL